MKKNIFLIVSFAFCIGAFAADLEDRLTKARADKAVAEQASGYLKALQPSPEVKALVDEVNEKRKKKYQEVTTQTSGVSLQSVEEAAGQKLLEKYK